MTLGKSLGGGVYANAAVLYRETDKVKNFTEKNPCFHTSMSGGSDIACSVSIKVIDYIRENKLCENAGERGKQLKTALEQIKEENPNPDKQE